MDNPYVPDSQPNPVQGSVAVISCVVADLLTRADYGIQKYGTLLMSNNGRDALLDALEEAYDLSMYLKQSIMEREDENNILWKIHVLLVGKSYLEEETIVELADLVYQILKKRNVNGVK